MKVWGVSKEAIDTIVTSVSKKYDDNLCYKRQPEPDGRAVGFTLTVRDTRKRGSRRSNTGRRVSACCWHGYRDVMMAIFMENPESRVKTGCADYRGIVDFVEQFPSTGRVNRGSMMAPMAYQDACNCKELCDE